MIILSWKNLFLFFPNDTLIRVAILFRRIINVNSTNSNNRNIVFFTCSHEPPPSYHCAFFCISNQIKKPAKPGISHRCHLKHPSLTKKTGSLLTLAFQKKNSSHPYHFLISQVCHLKTASLIACPSRQISRPCHLGYFPFVSLWVSHPYHF